MNIKPAAIDRFYSLDVLRGLAALSVVFWHWQHFFYSGTTPGSFVPTKLPLYDWVSVLYTKGWLAVDLFFSLSGFIFYWLYSKRVSENNISLAKFSFFRFSRLYPLHFLVLIFIAACQIWLLGHTGSYFVYPNNDGKHFILNLFFASSWGFERGYSFNGPIWSVSVEVLLYLIFFICSKFLPIRVFVLASISAIGFLVIQKYYQPIGRGIGSFFIGGCVYLAYRSIVTSHRTVEITRLIYVLTIAAWVTMFSVGRQFLDLKAYSVSWLLQLDTKQQWLIQRVFNEWPVVVLFPLTILTLALIETNKGSLGRRVAVIGDISYSSYLLHFPLQLVIFGLINSFAIDKYIYYSSWFMALFFVVLLIASFASFHFIEMPCQKLLRYSGIAKRL